MIIDNKIVKAESGKCLRLSFNNKLYDQLDLGNNTILVNGSFVDVNITLDNIEEVYPVKLENTTYYSSAVDYDHLVAELVRSKYSIDEELAIQANARIGHEPEKEEQFQAWRAKCKQVAKQIFA